MERSEKEKKTLSGRASRLKAGEEQLLTITERRLPAAPLANFNLDPTFLDTSVDMYVY